LARPGGSLQEGDDFLVESGEGEPLVGLDVEALAVEGLGYASEDAFLVAEVVAGGGGVVHGGGLVDAHVEIGGEDVFGRCADVGGHGDGFE